MPRLPSRNSTLAIAVKKHFDLPLPPSEESNGMHMQSSHIGHRISERHGIDTARGQQPPNRWVDCVITCILAKDEQPD